MLISSLFSLSAWASEPRLYSDFRFATVFERAVLPAGTTGAAGIGPQRAVFGGEWFYGEQRFKMGANFYEQFHAGAPENSPVPQLWDAQWQLRMSEKFILNAGRQSMPIGRSDAPIQIPSVQPHSLTQLLGQSQFRADSVGLALQSNVNVEASVASIGQDIDGQQRFLASTRFSHIRSGHHHSMSIAYKAYSQDPFVVLALEQYLGALTLGVTATTGANDSKAFWGAEGRLSWTTELDKGDFQALRLHERTAYLSPSGALRDLESRLQSDTALELVYKGPCRFGLAYSLFYPINATIPIVHRTSLQLHIDY